MPPDWLVEIKRVYGLRQGCEDTLLKAIKGARKQGIPWQAIGEAMGMTQQGARQRWRDKVEPPIETK